MLYMLNLQYLLTSNLYSSLPQDSLEEAKHETKFLNLYKVGYDNLHNGYIISYDS